MSQRSRNRWGVMLIQSVLGLVFFGLAPVVASSLLAGLLYGLDLAFHLSDQITWIEMLILAPVLYLSWLNLFLASCAVDMQAWGMLYGYKKPRRASTADPFPGSLNFYLTFLLYMRERLVQAMPFVNAYMVIPGLRNLALLAYSRSLKIGARSMVLGRLYDPDLTEIGSEVILGAGTTITAHSFTTNPDGSVVLVTAPIIIGDRAVVGGDTRLDPGVRIGADALVEPASAVSAFTIIGEGEVWGGMPARFLRKRGSSNENAAAIPAPVVAAIEPPQACSVPMFVPSNHATVPATLVGGIAGSDENEDALRKVVALVLDLPLDAVHANLRSEECAAWDSLGQLGLSAALHDRFGISLSAEESFGLKSMADLRAALRKKGVMPAISTTEIVGSNENEDALRKVVALALDLPLDAVHANLRSDECAAWDSLGQLGLSAALHDRFGISLSAEESFGLKSMADLRAALHKKGAMPAVSTAASTIDPVQSSCTNAKTACVASQLPTDPELLPLLDHGQVTRRLVNQNCGLATTNLSATPVRGPVKIVVASTFVAEPLAGALKLWSRAFGIPVELRFAGFNQVQQCLTSPDGDFQQNLTGLNVVLTRPEDLLSRTGEPSPEAAESILSAIAEFAKRAPGTLAVATLPPVVSSFVSADPLAVDRLRYEWRNRLAQIGGLATLEFSKIIEQIGVAAAGSPDLEVVARSPYSAVVFQELGITLARLVRQQRVAPAKVIALDADGVLWGGVLGEEGLTGIHLGPDHPGRSFQLFQQQLKGLKERGCLLTVVSRNAEEDVWRVFDEHPEMILRREDITAVRINWKPKSGNIRELAAQLNLGLDAFVFIDDDPANHAEVAANAPGVTVIPMPTNPAEYCQTLSRLWRFDAPQVTREDRERASMMQAEQLREQGREATGDLASYLESLQLRVEMRRASTAELPRVAQLTQKTNQFNLSLKRRSLPEIQALAEAQSVYVIEASDRFGDYGLIGVAILGHDAAQAEEHVLDTLLLSCRALGRGVEDAILHGLCKATAASGGSRLVAPSVVGPRNQPCLDFLKRAQGQERSSGVYVFDAAAGYSLPTHINWITPEPQRVGRAA